MEEKKLKDYAHTKRTFFRLEKEKELKDNKILRKTYSLSNNNKKINFSSLNNFKNLFLYHFKKNNIPLISISNFKNESAKISDFRDSKIFRSIIKNEFNLNFDSKLIFYNLYFDSTNVSKVKAKRKNIFEVYLNFNNDLLKNNSKKIIYNICSIEEKLLKKINLNCFLEFLSRKLKKEVEDGFLINDIFVKAFCLFIIGDNKEQYELLRLKGNFGNNRWCCRCCDYDKQNPSNIETQITSNEDYIFAIDMIKSNEENTKFFNCKNEISNLFILKVFFLIFF
jgi:hypothetical protein